MRSARLLLASSMLARVAVLARPFELAFDQRLVAPQRLGGGIVTAVERRQFPAQVRFDPPRGLDVEPELVALASALRQLLALGGDLRFQLGHALAQAFGLGGLPGELLLQFPDALA